MYNSLSYAKYYTTAADYIKNDKIVKSLNLPFRTMLLMKLKYLNPQLANESEDAWLDRILPLAPAMIKMEILHSVIELMVEQKPVPEVDDNISNIVFANCLQTAQQMLLENPRLPNETDPEWRNRLYKIKPYTKDELTAMTADECLAISAKSHRLHPYCLVGLSVNEVKTRFKAWFGDDAMLVFDGEAFDMDVNKTYYLGVVEDGIVTDFKDIFENC